MNSLVKDLSTITTIPEATLSALIDKSTNILCHNVLESILKNENHIDLDIGIGTLHIAVEQDSIKYKFIPYKKLERAIIQAVETKESPLVNSLESLLSEKIQKAYKELM